MPSDVRALIRKRLNKVRLGHFGDIEHIEGPIYELRFHLGPGYRIYLGRKGNRIVILLCAGEKRSQKRDIAKAKKYWQEIK